MIQRMDGSQEEVFVQNDLAEYEPTPAKTGTSVVVNKIFTQVRQADSQLSNGARREAL